MGLPMLGRVFDAVGFRVPGGGGLKEAFVSFDKDRSGALTEPEFEASLPTQWRDALQGILFLHPPTHFSHMSHPTFPISHLLFLFF